MLSRMAWHLFWLGRYAQRAGVVARVLESAVAGALLPPSAGGGERPWQDALEICGDPDGFARRFGSGSPQLISMHLVRDDANPSALVSCLAQARENARIARGHLSPSAWESINAGYHDARAIAPAPPSLDLLARTAEAVTARIHHFIGTLYATLLHDDAWHFCCLGFEIERALGTALTLRLGARGGERPARWEAVLGYLGAETAYRAAYGPVIDGADVCALLVDHPRLSASLRHCAESVTRRLGLIASPEHATSLSLAGSLAESCAGSGLRTTAWIDAMVVAWHDMSARIHDDYLLAPCASPSAT